MTAECFSLLVAKEVVTCAQPVVSVVVQAQPLAVIVRQVSLIRRLVQTLVRSVNHAQARSSAVAVSFHPLVYAVSARTLLINLVRSALRAKVVLPASSATDVLVVTPGAAPRVQLGSSRRSLV